MIPSGLPNRFLINDVNNNGYGESAKKFQGADDGNKFVWYKKLCFIKVTRLI